MTASLPSPSPSGARATHASGSILRAWIEVAGRALTENVDQINDLNVFPVPDADTGTNSNATFQAAIRAVAELPADADALTVARSMGRAAALGARGNSGVILSQMLRGVSEAAIDPERPFTAVALARVLESAAVAGREAVADPRDGTMLSVMTEAAHAASEAVSSGDVALVSVAAADAARRSLEDTPNHLAVLAAAGVVDAGGRMIVVVLDSLAEVLTGIPRPVWQAPVLTRSCEIDSIAATYNGPAYEVMYVLHAEAPAIADVRAQLVSLGDSLAVVGGDDLWNVHVHVDDPSAAVDIGRAAGTLESLRVTYLRTGFAHNGASERTALVVALPQCPLADDLAGSGVLVAGMADAEVVMAVAAASDDVILCVPRILQMQESTHRIAQVICPSAAHVIAAASVWDGAMDFDDAVNQIAAAVSHVTTAAVVADGDAYIATGAANLVQSAPDFESAVLAAVNAIRAPHHEIATLVVNPSAIDVGSKAVALVVAATGLTVDLAVCPTPGARAVIGLE